MVNSSHNEDYENGGNVLLLNPLGTHYFIPGKSMQDFFTAHLFQVYTLGEAVVDSEELKKIARVQKFVTPFELWSVDSHND